MRVPPQRTLIAPLAGAFVSFALHYGLISMILIRFDIEPPRHQPHFVFLGSLFTVEDLETIHQRRTSASNPLPASSIQTTADSFTQRIRVVEKPRDKKRDDPQKVFVKTTFQLQARENQKPRPSESEAEGDPAPALEPYKPLKVY